MREFFEAVLCDDVKDLSTRRTEWRMRAQLDDSNRLERVLQRRETDMDRTVLTHVMESLRRRDHQALSVAGAGCHDIKCAVM